MESMFWIYSSLSLAHMMLLSSSSGEVVPKDIQTNTISLNKCGPGQYGHNGQCTPCSICTNWEYAKHKCNSTHNAVCECIPGYYRDLTDGECKQCTRCAVGWGASPACTRTSNTVCVACPKGSYSSVESSTKSCQSCTLCDRRYEVVINQCTSQKDTTCFKGNKDSSTNGKMTSSQLCKGETCESSKDTAYLYTAPLYCAVLGAIILGLLIYVILRCRINKNRSAQLAAGKISQKQSLNHNVLTQQCLSGELVTTPLIYLQNGGKTIVVTPNTRYKEIRSSARRAVSRSLAHDGSWLKLAHSLEAEYALESSKTLFSDVVSCTEKNTKGFTPSEISLIQQKAERSYKATPPASILLNEWTKRDASTVGVIVHALANINRLDLINLIHSSNSMKGSEIV